MRACGVPVFDMFNPTDGARSVDPTNCGLGVNRLTVRVLFLYLR